MSEKLIYKKRFYDLETEECWLNEMCAGGLVLKKIDWGIFTDKYIFEPCTKKYVCRIDYNPEMGVLDEITSPYTMFVTGTYEAEFICCANGKLYFRKAEDKGDFPPIYTSIDSRIAAEKKRLLQNIPSLIIILIYAVYIFYVVLSSFAENNVDMKRLSIVCFVMIILCLIPIPVTIIRHALKIRSLKKLDENGNFPPVYTSEELGIADAKKGFNRCMIFSAMWLVIFLAYFFSSFRSLDFSDRGSKQFVSDFVPFIAITVSQLGLSVYWLVLALRRRKTVKKLEKNQNERK